MRTNGVTAARNIAQVLSGPYRVPNIHFEIALLLTNKTPSGTYRGPGRFEADFFRERLFDMAANDLGIDRVEFRRSNLVAEHEMPWALPNVQPLDQGSATDSGDYQQTLDRCLAEFGWAEKAKLQGKLIDGRYHGIAVGCYLEGGGSGPRENARMVLESDGTVSVYVGSSAVGQGVETVLAQIAADALEMPMARINRVYHGSTTVVKQGFGSYSSRSMVMGGSAIVQAAGLLRTRSAPPPPSACNASRTTSSSTATTRSGRTARRSRCRRSPPTASPPKAPIPATSAPTATARTPPMSRSIPAPASRAARLRGRRGRRPHHQSADAARPDRRRDRAGTGRRAPRTSRLRRDGQFLTGSLADYLMPTASDFPVIRAHALEEKPAPHNPLGAKGAGEGGIIPVGGVIANAVAAALGVEPRELPLSPPQVWELIQAKRIIVVMAGRPTSYLANRTWPAQGRA